VAARRHRTADLEGLLMGFLSAGEALIDDVSVIANPGTPSATQLIQNGSFQGDAIGAAPQKWRIIGNHKGSIVADPDNASNKVLDLLTTGPTEHEGNNAQTTFVGNTAVVNGTTYLISFRARWIGGSNQLNARFFLNRIGHVHSRRPENRHARPKPLRRQCRADLQ
jgi:hypothetical protein